jgi:hypothetical protein
VCDVTDSLADSDGHAGSEDQPSSADGLILSGRPARAALTSLVEALCLAASRILQIDEGELAGNWNPVLGETETAADLYLYDLLPGGAGYVHQVRRNLSAVLEETRTLLEVCDCASSCHRCLRHYNNQRQHSQLDRHLALALLRHLQDGSIPELSWAEQLRAIGPLYELLRLRGKRCERAEPGPAPGVQVPLRVQENNADAWVLVHHPLVSPLHGCQEALLEAALQLVPVVAIDAHTLEHDLPTAHRKLQTLVEGV